MACASNIQWCEPCGRAGENQQAHSWCSECSESLCGECLKFHKRGKTTAIHKTIPILEAKKLSSTVLDIPDTCHIHDDQKLSLFCIHHDQICCAFCLREFHNTCKDVKSIEQASKGVKMGSAIDDLQYRISECSLMIGKILDKYKNNLSSLSDQKDEYKGKLRNFRKELNIFLDALEQEIDTKIDVCDMECTSEIEKIIKDLTTRKKKSESRQTAIETLTEHASETRIFAAIKTIDLLQVGEELFLSKCQEGLVTYELRSPPFDFIEKIKPILAALSDINIQKYKTTVQHSLNPQQVHTFKLHKGNPKILHQTNCSKLKLPVFKKACFTMNNRIVFVEFPLRVYDISSSSVQTIQTKYGSTNITCDRKNNIYASFPSVGIYNIDIKNLNEGRCINQTNSKHLFEYELVKLNNNMLYSNIEKGIVIYNEEGTVAKVLNCTFKARFMCLEKRGEILLADGKSIIHMTESGLHNEIPVKMRTCDEITGLDVDNQGQLFACICNKEKGAVERINTTTGYREPVLENLVTPRDIAFHPDLTKNMFLVMTDHGKECTVYQF